MVEHNLLDELEMSFIELHQAQLNSARVPEIYWKSLFRKLREEKFDAGDYFQICMRIDEEEEILGYKAICAAENGLDKNDPNGVFLVDHAWTYRLNEARVALAENENLLNRMIALMNIKPSDLEKENQEEESSVVSKSIVERKIDAVMKAMWKYNQTYKLSTEKKSDEERESIWYIMDELGSSIRHSDDPSVECMPFLYIPNGTMYSLIWPTRSLNKGGWCKKKRFCLIGYSILAFVYAYFAVFKIRFGHVFILKNKLCFLNNFLSNYLPSNPNPEDELKMNLFNSIEIETVVVLCLI